MIRINCRQLYLCKDYFDKVTDNILEYNQITKLELIQKWKAICIEKCSYGSRKDEVFQTLTISFSVLSNINIPSLHDIIIYNKQYSYKFYYKTKIIVIVKSNI